LIFRGSVVIEYGLLFGLGFVTALLAVLLLAPAVHRRIVKFTEDRIMATVPVSPAELRAQKDMVRAEMATTVARTGHDLKLERQRAAQFSIANDQLSLEAGRLAGENADLKNEMDEMTVQASELRASLRKEELRIEQLKETLANQERSERSKDTQIEALQGRVRQLGADIDNLKIDLVTRDTEAEGLKARISALRDERETLRNDVKRVTQRAKDAELHLAREENRANRLEERLNSEVAGSIDKDTVIERRLAEIQRLKERLKSVNADTRDSVRGGKSPESASPAVANRIRVAAANADERRGLALPDKRKPEAKPAEVAVMRTRFISDERVAELAEDVRGQAAAAADTLVNLSDERQDEALRNEIADIAAKMIAVTGQREGGSSPIRSMIAGKGLQGRDGRLSLSERAARLIRQD
jgi:DNA repair exonuclease SbcCD ATPase subunit